MSSCDTSPATVLVGPPGATTEPFVLPSGGVTAPAGDAPTASAVAARTAATGILSRVPISARTAVYRVVALMALSSRVGRASHARTRQAAALAGNPYSSGSGPGALGAPPPTARSTRTRPRGIRAAEGYGPRLSAERDHDGWVVRESGPAGAEHAVLLLPGALCTAAFYDDLIAEPSLGSIRLVATTLPGFGGTRPSDDPSVEGYAAAAARLARELGCDAVVGHSVGANVALELAAAGAFAGPLVLLSPSFSRRDESRFPRALDRLATVLGPLPYAAMLKLVGPALGSSLPPHRREALVAELKRNDPRFLRRQTHLYLEYLDRHGSLAPRLCASRVPAWVAFGERDDVGLADGERRALEECASVTLVEIADAGHMTLNQQPGRVAELVLAALAG